MCLLYEVGIFFAQFISKRRKAATGRRRARRASSYSSVRGPRAALAHGHVERELLVAAHHLHRHRLARRHLGDRVQRRVHVGHRAGRSIADDHVAQLACRPSRRGCPARSRRRWRRACPSAPATRRAPGVMSATSTPNQPRVTDAGLDDLLHHALGEAHGDREADALVAAGAREDERVDADQVAVGVDERAAGVARIDRRVGLDEAAERVRRSRSRAPPR